MSAHLGGRSAVRGENDTMNRSADAALRWERRWGPSARVSIRVKVYAAAQSVPL